MKIHHLAAAGCLSLAALCAAAQAATLAADGQWAGFAVDANLPPYSISWIDADHAPLSLRFTIAEGFQGVLTVVDSVYSGDRFTVTDNGLVLGTTGAAVDGYDAVNPGTFNPDDALANPNFSRASFTLGAGTHTVSGWLSTSLVVDGAPTLATEGAVRLAVSAVPEPASLATLLAGLSLLTVVLRRRGNPK